jgi:predicted nucleic acid-binding protein
VVITATCADGGSARLEVDPGETTPARLPAPLILLDPAWLRDALALAKQHSLSGYDAHWAAAARHLGVPLVSADRQLLDSGLAESATSAATRLGLR